MPIIYLFARKVLMWGETKRYIGPFFSWCIRKGESSKSKLTLTRNKGVFITLFLFVGVPLPGTGAWTGTLAASFLNLNFKRTVFSVFCGVILSGLIMSLGTTGVVKLFHSVF